MSAAVDDLAAFGIGAAIPTLILLGYNQLAFGSPWEMGYFHQDNPRVCRSPQRRRPARTGLARIVLGKGIRSSSGAGIAD